MLPAFDQHLGDMVRSIGRTQHHADDLWHGIEHELAVPSIRLPIGRTRCRAGDEILDSDRRHELSNRLIMSSSSSSSSGGCCRSVTPIVYAWIAGGVTSSSPRLSSFSRPLSLVRSMTSCAATT